MRKKVDAFLIRARYKLEEELSRLANEEAGASEIVAIILIIVVVIAVAGIFKTQLMELVNSVFDKLNTFVNE